MKGWHDRRQMIAFLLASASTLVVHRANGQSPSDRGIGGTGAVPNDQSDRGIGGTGVIGTIRKFGSIYVNDMRIAYPTDVDVTIDGQAASAADLRIGQVVRVTATGGEGKLSTHAIEVTSEVVGPIDSIGPSSMTVLGQTVRTAGVKTKGLKPGDLVAVSGLRRPDGSVAASLIERSPGAASRITGPLTRAADGSLDIAGQKVTGVDPALAGRRVVADGSRTGSAFVVTRAVAETSLFPPDLRDVSIETYVERQDGRLRFASGFTFDGHGLNVPEGRAVRAVLHAEIDADGRFAIATARIGTRVIANPGFSGRSPAGLPSQGRGTAGPGNFQRGPSAGPSNGGFGGPGGPGGAPAIGNPGFNNPGFNNPGFNNPGFNNPGGFDGPGGNRPGGFGGGFNGPGGEFRGGGRR